MALTMPFDVPFLPPMVAISFQKLTQFVTLFVAAFAQNAPSPLVNFQVSQPLTLPKSVNKCQVPLIDRVFANSYYKPEILQYTPPTNCGPVGSWAGISLNWTATSKGNQYDRLAGVTLQNVEIWRTSTSEPSPNGIIWTVLKDVTKYLPLFSKPGTLIVDLNNIIDPASDLTGEYDVQLTATFYQSDATHQKGASSDLIIPLSILSSDQSNIFSVPPAGITNVTLPSNAITAIVEIQASGNANDEFWYVNLPDEYLKYIPPDVTYGKGPFREVQLLVDGLLAGIVLPYPVLFTGAFVPAVWRPITGYGTHDLPTYNIDLTPFIPLLTDGKNHSIALQVLSDEPDRAINPNWYLSGNIQVALDPSGKQTKGNITNYEAPSFAAFSHSISSYRTVYNFTSTAFHSILIEADITSGSGITKHVVWKQDMRFRNFQMYWDDAVANILNQTAVGLSVSTHDGTTVLSDSFNFPFDIYFSLMSDETGRGWITTFDQTYDREHLPSPWEISTKIYSEQSAGGINIRVPNTGYPRRQTGSNSNNFTYSDSKMNSYYRLVDATNSTVIKDEQGGSLSWDVWPLATGDPEGAAPGVADSEIPLEPFRMPRKHILQA